MRGMKLQILKQMPHCSVSKLVLSATSREDGISGTCITCERVEDMHTKLGKVNTNERDHLEDLGIDGSIKTDLKRSRV
jgi:hypothetical protein